MLKKRSQGSKGTEVLRERDKIVYQQRRILSDSVRELEGYVVEVRPRRIIVSVMVPGEGQQVFSARRYLVRKKS